MGGVAEWYSRYILQQAGVDPNSVTYEGTGGLPQSQAALEQGRVSAIFAGPAQDAVLRAAGHPVIFSWMDSEAYKGTARSHSPRWARTATSTIGRRRPG